MRRRKFRIRSFVGVGSHRCPCSSFYWWSQPGDAGQNRSLKILLVMVRTIRIHMHACLDAYYTPICPQNQQENSKKYHPRTKMHHSTSFCGQSRIYDLNPCPMNTHKIPFITLHTSHSATHCRQSHTLRCRAVPEESALQAQTLQLLSQACSVWGVWSNMASLQAVLGL